MTEMTDAEKNVQTRLDGERLGRLSDILTALTNQVEAVVNANMTLESSLARLQAGTRRAKAILEEDK